MHDLNLFLYDADTHGPVIMEYWPSINASHPKIITSLIAERSFLTGFRRYHGTVAEFVRRTVRIPVPNKLT